VVISFASPLIKTMSRLLFCALCSPPLYFRGLGLPPLEFLLGF